MEQKKIEKLKVLLAASDSNVHSILLDIAKDHDFFVIPKNQLTQVDISMDTNSHNLTRVKMEFVLTDNKVDKEIYEMFYDLNHTTG